MGGMNPMMTLMLARKDDAPRAEYGRRIDDRFKDRTGREHYDDGRFAPMRGEYEGGMQMGYGTSYPTHMGYSEPVRMGDNEEEGRRSWKIIENNGYGHTEPMYNGDGMRRVMGFAGSSVDYHRIDEMSHRSGEKMPGHASAKGLPMMTREMAEEWMANIHNEDGTKGPHWSLEEVKTVMRKKGLQGDPVRIWVAMNAEYSDMVMVNRKHGVDEDDYYFDAALARWINDRDAVKDKEAAYYMYVVKH